MRLAKILRDRRDLLDKIYGGVEDLVLSNNLDNIYKKLGEKEKTLSEFNKYEGIRNKLSKVQLEDKDYYSDETEIDYSNPALLESNAFAEYGKYVETLQNKPENVTTADFEHYLSMNPLLKTEVEGAYSKNKLKDADQLKYDKYTKAGIGEEDISFYEGYSPPYAKGYNKELLDVYNKYSPKLQGNYSGDKYTKQFANKISGLSLPEEKEADYQINFDKDEGTMTYVDKNDPSNINTVKYKDKKNELTKYLTNQNNWVAEEGEDGSLYWGVHVYDPSTNTSKFVRTGKMTNEEAADYKVNKDKANKTGAYTPKKSGRSKGGSKKTGVDFGLDSENDINTDIVSGTDKQKVASKSEYDEPVSNKFAKMVGWDSGEDELEGAVSEGNIKGVREIESEVQTYVNDIKVLVSSGNKADLQKAIEEMYEYLGEALFKGGNYSQDYIDNLYEEVNNFIAQLK